MRQFLFILCAGLCVLGPMSLSDAKEVGYAEHYDTDWVDQEEWGLPEDFGDSALIPHDKPPLEAPLAKKPEEGIRTAASPDSRMTRAQIAEVAQTCQGKIHQLWAERAQIPREKIAIFQRAICEAQKACKQVQQVDKALAQTDEEIRSFDENMLVAQSQY